MKSRDELIEMVRKIMNAEGTEKEIDDLITSLSENVIDPDLTNYIFSKKYEGLSAENIIDKAQSYKTIKLGSGIRKK